MATIVDMRHPQHVITVYPANTLNNCSAPGCHRQATQEVSDEWKLFQVCLAHMTNVIEHLKMHHDFVVRWNRDHRAFG